MKSIWNGSISFGMVNIPVKLFSVIDRSETVHFKLLYKEDYSPIEYKRWSKEHDREVPWEDVVKGVEMDDGSYYVFTKEELDSIRPERSDVIEIIHFVSRGSIDDLYMDRHYFVAPGRPLQKPFFLLGEALRTTDRVAIGRFVMREREHVCTIEPHGNALLLSTLNYSYELRDPSKIEEIAQAPDLGEEEIDLAIKLIDHLFLDDLDMGEFRDCYAERLKKAIESRDEEHVVRVERAPEATSDENLIEMLKASLEA